MYSGYKEELSDRDIETFVFRDYDDARANMLSLAEQIYEKDDIIQEANDKYFEVYQNSVYFGENPGCGTNYRAAWGMVKLEEVTLQ